MSITASSNPAIVTGTKGQFSKVCCTFTSTESLIGETVKLKPGLFLDNPSDVPSFSANHYLVNYPPIGTTVDFNFAGNPTTRNYQATIEAIDDKTFIICLEFFWFGDLDNYADYPYNNYDIWADQGTNSVYEQGKYLNLFVEIDGEQAICATYMQANDFCTGDISFDWGDGYCIGEDLEITITGNSQSIIGNTFYVGFYDQSALANNIPFWQDSDLNYGYVSGGISQVPTMGAMTPPIDCLKSATPFIGNGNNYSATVTIDSSCLVGNKYRLYVIYKENGEWKSCLSDPICKIFNKLLVFTEDLICCSVVDSFGNLFEDCCVTNLAGCGEFKVCLQIKRPELEAVLLAAGYDGIMEDYISSCTMYLSYGSATTTGAGLGFSKIFDADGLNLCLDFDATGFEGLRYVTACILFEFYPIGGGGIDLGEGEFDVYNPFQKLCIPIELSFVSPIETILEYTLDGDEIEDVYCCEWGGLLEFDPPEDDCDLLLEQNDGTSLNLGNDIDAIDANELACDEEQCVKFICFDEPVIIDPPDCDCPPCEDLTIELGIALINQNTVRFLYVFNKSVTGTAEDVTSNTVENINSQTGQLEFPNDNYINIRFELECPNGCLYSFGCPVEMSEIEFPTDYEKTNSYISTTPFEDCDCPDECAGGNTGFVDWECDENGITKCETNITTNSPVDTDTGDVKTETQDGNGNIIKCEITRTITFADGCPDLIISDVIDCDVQTNCINSRIINYTVDPECKLSITLTESFDSGILSDKFYIKINGVTTEYDLFNGDTIPPSIQLNDGDTVCLWSTTIFDDGCPDYDSIRTEFTATKEVSPSACDYSGYGVQCSYDEETCEFSAVFVGDETMLISEEKKFCINGSKETNYKVGKPVIGTGTFIVTWYIQKEGCDVFELSDYCSVKPEVQDINIPPIEFPEKFPVEICNWDDMPTCCDEEECCTGGLTYQCDPVECRLVAAFDCPRASEYELRWCDSNDQLIITGNTLNNLTEDISGTLKAIHSGDCPNVETAFEYTHIDPNTTVTNQ